MSVTAHLSEMYFAKYKAPRLNFRWLVVGCYFPDGWGLSKLIQLATGTSIMHRDLVFGWTHSLPACGAVALAVGARFGARAGWSFAIASWLHTLMDLGDPLGVKLFFPFSDTKFALGLWPWSDTSLWTDTLAYYTSPVSLAIELACLMLALYATRVMTGTANPIRGTAILWSRESWSDRGAPIRVEVVELPADGTP